MTYDEQLCNFPQSCLGIIMKGLGVASATKNSYAVGVGVEDSKVPNSID